MSYDITLGRYYNRVGSIPEHKDYKKLLFRAGDSLQSAEMNDIQETLNLSLKTYADKFIANGETIKGGEVLIEDSNKTIVGTDIFYDFTVKANAGIIYVDGFFVSVDAKEILTSQVKVEDYNKILGIQINYTVVTDSDDTTLRDPAVETRNYQQPGAARLKIIAEWMFEENYVDDGVSTFLPLYVIHRGNIESNIETQKWDSSMIDIAAKYDRNANGNYVIDGYEVDYLETKITDPEDPAGHLGTFVLNIADGNANVYGYNYETEVSQTLDLKPLSDFELKNSEPFAFDGDKFYTPRHLPIRKVYRVSGQVRVTDESVTHGAFSGSSDEIGNDPSNPRQPVIEIFRVYDSVNEYIAGIDYEQAGDSISWYPAGTSRIDADGNQVLSKEPAPSSSYKVTYNYQKTYTQDDFVDKVDVGNAGQNGYINPDIHSIYLTGFDPGTNVQVDYDFILKRNDAIYLNEKGDLGSIVGVPDEDSPHAPSIDNKGTLLQLATVLLQGDAKPIVTQDNQRVFKMADIQLLLDGIKENQYNISKLALKENLKENQPTSTFMNSFLDDFEDDDLRDDGYGDIIDASGNIVQSYNDAMIVGGNLVLDINFDTLTNSVDTGSEERDSLEIDSISLGTILSQTYWTKTRQINEYLFKAAPEATLYIEPKVYKWVSRNNYSTFVRSIQSSTRTINTWSRRWGWWGWWRGSTTTTSVSRQILGNSRRTTSTITTSRRLEVIPRISIHIWSKPQDFNSGENVSVKFDKAVLPSTYTTDSNGKLDIRFNIPPNQLSGMKEIFVEGVDSGVTGKTIFQAQPLERNIQTTVTTWWRWVVRRNTTWWWRADPVAQTFILDETTPIEAIGVYFDVLPTTDVACVITEVTAGLPDKTKALTSKSMHPSECVLAGSNNTINWFNFDNKVTLSAGKEYAFIIICKDAVGSVRVAELGARDKSGTGKWLTSQAYSIGVLFNSSNGSAWTPLQAEDMQFQIKGCKYDTAGKTFEVSPIVNGVTTGFTVEDVTDLMVLANAKIEAGTSISYRVTLLDRGVNNVFNVAAYSQFPLTTKYTGRVKVEAILSTTGNFSPRLEPSVQLMAGKCKRESHYTSRAFEVSQDAQYVDAYIDCFQPANTNISIWYQKKIGITQAEDEWVKLPEVDVAKNLGNNWVEKHFRIAVEPGTTIEDKTRIRIDLVTSNDSNRPVVANLRTTIQKI